MGYKKADAVLPKELLDEIQKYVEGEYLYIPKSTTKSGWGGKKIGSKRRTCHKKQ